MSVSLHVSQRHHWQVLTLSGRIDAFSDRRIVAVLRQAVLKPGASIALDLSSCEFLSLYTLKSLLEWNEQISKDGGRFIIFSPAECICRQLDIFLGRQLTVAWAWEALEIEAFYQNMKRSVSLAKMSAEENRVDRLPDSEKSAAVLRGPSDRA